VVPRLLLAVPVGLLPVELLARALRQRSQAGRSHWRSLASYWR